METIRGEVEEIIYKNELNGYTIFNIDCEEENDVITVLATTVNLNIGEFVIATGKFIEHEYYGRQFKADLCDKGLPKKKSSIAKFLGSGIIKGMGETTALRIIDRFGEDSFAVMLSQPDKLAEIKGISKTKADTICESFREYSEMWNVAMFLQKYGISPAYINRIYKKFGNKAVDVINENPYILADEITGIGFKTADKVALSLGFDVLSDFRVASAIMYVLSMMAMGNGHTYIPKSILAQNVNLLLNTADVVIDNGIVSLSRKNKIVVENFDGEDIIYLKSLYYCERSVAIKLLDLSLINFKKDLPYDLEDRIKDVEDDSKIKLADEQKDAVLEALKNGVTVITGGPGTGKTTIINTIIQLLDSIGLTYLMAAPTGRAAKRITEATGQEAKTIHRMLELVVKDDNSFAKFEENEDSNVIITEDVVIVDEASMIDITLMNHLLKAIPVGTRLIIVGDKDQLPSVGPGNVLKDVINSNAVKVVNLSKIYRQAEMSMIVVNAHSINRGEYPVFNKNDTDFFNIRAVKHEEILSNILDVMTRRLPSSKGYNPINDIQVLSATKKGILGVRNINIELQNILNPKAKSKKEVIFGDFVFRVGDKVMQVRNNYDISWSKVQDSSQEGIGLFNGDIGYVVDIDEENGSVISVFDDKRVIHDRDSLEQLELAYAITVHKSQGSEFKVVLMPVFSGFSMLNTRNLLYTAITRAREMVVIVGRQEDVNTMVDNYKEVKRYSGLGRVLTGQN